MPGAEHVIRAIEKECLMARARDRIECLGLGERHRLIGSSVHLEPGPVKRASGLGDVESVVLVEQAIGGNIEAQRHLDAKSLVEDLDRAGLSPRLKLGVGVATGSADRGPCGYGGNRWGLSGKTEHHATAAGVTDNAE